MRWIWSGVLASAAATPAVAATGYLQPPDAMVKMIDAPVTPTLLVAPDQRTALMLEREAMLSIAQVAGPELKLAGLRIDPRTNDESRMRLYKRMTVLTLPAQVGGAMGQPRPVSGLPAGARLGNFSWAPGGRHAAFTVTAADGVQLWVLDLQRRQARRLGQHLLLNGLGGSLYRWLPDGRTLVARALPRRGPAPKASTVPAGPVVQQSFGRKAAAPTYADMLQNPHDEDLFAYYMGTQVVRVALTGAVTPVGKPGLIETADPSPDGRYLLVHELHRPFSYHVPYELFPVRYQVRDLATGRVVRQLADLPLAETIPTSFDATRAGVRDPRWRADADATVAWNEAGDGGDPKRDVAVRDRLYALAAPFRGQGQVLMEFGFRAEGVQWGNDHLAIAGESWHKTRRTRSWLFQPGVPGAKPKAIVDRSSEDRYGDPGDALMHADRRGRGVLLTSHDGKSLFLEGEGASPQGNRPFLDRYDLASGHTTRLWRSEAPHYEHVVRLLDDSGTRVVTTRESQTEPPNFCLRNLATHGLQPLTHFPNPFPGLVGVHKELITYQRKDGVKLSGTLYTPPGYTPDQGPLPMLMWAYPREFKSADAAGQVTDSPYRFDRPSGLSPLLLLSQGYAIFDDPKLPIIGAGKDEPNDTYVQQLVAGAQAAVDEVVRRGVADRHRIAIGGHSYGAFMTANLLAHSHLFAAGIARSGAYNRTLTPFGFQGEERTYWQASETYDTMSPFRSADKIEAPLLLIHGMADNNQGTNPIQSERLYAAVSGLGGNVRLVMLPAESHGYQARESVMHVMYEMNRWLDRYVKNRKESAQ